MFLDNCSAHPSEEELILLDGTITVKFLPPNVTAILQPTDQGVIQSIKRVYRKSILRDFVTQSTFIIQNFPKRFDMIKVVDTVVIALDNVTDAVTRNSWKKLMSLPSSSM